MLGLASATGGRSKLLGESTAFRYQGVSQIFDLSPQQDESLNDAIAIEGISAHQPRKAMVAAERRSCKIRTSLCPPPERLLLVTVLTGNHKNVICELASAIAFVCRQMGLEPSQLQRMCSAGHVQRDSGGRVVGEGIPNEGFKPVQMRPCCDDYPTVIVEASLPQAWQNLQSKGDWWFKVSDFAVKIVLLVKMDPGKCLRIEKWKAIPQHFRLGAKAQQRAPAPNASPLEPTLNQAITIHAPQGMRDADPARYLPKSYRVTSRLRLEFADVTLREPCPGEDDIVISTTILQKYAAKIRL